MRKLLPFLIFVSLPLFAATPMSPGRYKDWGPGIDDIEIAKAFHMSDYDRVVVLPFDTASTPLPDKKEKSYDTIKSALATYTYTLVETFKPELKAKVEVEQADKAPKTAKTLVIRGKVEELNPGSRAKRYLAGALAGASGTKVSGEIIDAKSGELLARFTNTERSHGSFKFGGGSDLDVMRDSIHATGKKLARMLNEF
jgi:uncharacterized protein DUF4410